MERKRQKINKIIEIKGLVCRLGKRHAIYNYSATGNGSWNCIWNEILVRDGICA